MPVPHPAPDKRPVAGWPWRFRGPGAEVAAAPPEEKAPAQRERKPRRSKGLAAKRPERRRPPPTKSEISSKPRVSSGTPAVLENRRKPETKNRRTRRGNAKGSTLLRREAGRRERAEDGSFRSCGSGDSYVSRVAAFFVPFSCGLFGASAAPELFRRLSRLDVPQFSQALLFSRGTSAASRRRLAAFRLQPFDFPHPRKRPPDMRDGNGTAHNERHIQSVNHFRASPALFGAAHQVIRDAIVAPKHCRRDQPQQLLGLRPERPRFIGLVVQRKEPLDPQMPTPQNLLIQIRPAPLKLLKTVWHVTLSIPKLELRAYHAAAST